MLNFLLISLDIIELFLWLLVTLSNILLISGCTDILQTACQVYWILSSKTEISLNLPNPSFSVLILLFKHNHVMYIVNEDFVENL